AADERRAHLARDYREEGRHALVLGAGPEDGLAQPRDARDGDAPRVDGRVGLEMIDRSADSPGPGADGPPFVRGRSRLTWSERKADPPLRPAVGSVGLDVPVVHRGVPPPAAEQLAHGVESGGRFRNLRLLVLVLRWRSGLVRGRAARAEA